MTVILHRYVLRELLLAFLFIFVVVTLVVFFAYLFQSFRSFQGMGSDFMLRTAPVLLLYVVPYTLLIALVAATTLCYGRLSSDNEIDAMRVSGVHVGRVVIPAVLVGLVVSGASLYLHRDLVPYSMSEQRRMQKEGVLHLLKAPPPGAQTIWIGENALSYKDYVGGAFRNLDVLVFDKGIRKAKYSALEATIEVRPDGVPMLKMPKGTITYYQADRLNELSVEDYTQVLDVKLNLEANRPKYVKTDELYEFYGGDRKFEAMTEFHVRHAKALYPLVLAVMAALVGVFVRKASKLAGLGASLPPVVLYFVLSIAFERLGTQGRIPPAVAAYTPCVLMGVLDCVLFVRVRK